MFLFEDWRVCPENRDTSLEIFYSCNWRLVSVKEMSSCILRHYWRINHDSILENMFVAVHIQFRASLQVFNTERMLGNLVWQYSLRRRRRLNLSALRIYDSWVAPFLFLWYKCTNASVQIDRMKQLYTLKDYSNKIEKIKWKYGWCLESNMWIRIGCYYTQHHLV